MSYRIYNTEGVIITNYPSRETDRQLRIYTKDFGLILVNAQGVRTMKSKLRYGLQDYSIVYLSMVRGKNRWRLVGVENILTLNNIIKTEEKVAVVSMIFSFIIKFTDEGKDIILYTELRKVIAFLNENNFTNKQLQTLEILTLFLCLHILGFSKLYSDYLDLPLIWNMGLLDIPTEKVKVLSEELHTILNHI